MKCIGIVAVMLIAMSAIVTVKPAQDNNRVGVVGAVFGSAASIPVLTGACTSPPTISSDNGSIPART